MSNILSQSLGLDSVEADPNFLPNGTYEGVVHKSVLVYVDSKDTLSHVITYKVTEDGDYKGKQKDEWFTLGTAPRLKDGSTPTKGEVALEDLAGFTPGMTPQAKPWYKKRHIDLGINEADVANTEPAALTGIPVNFGVKKNGSYVNINFVERRDVTTQPPANLNSGDTNTESTSAPASLDF